MTILEYAESKGYELQEHQKNFLLAMEQASNGSFAPINIKGIEPTCDEIYNEWIKKYRHV